MLEDITFPVWENYSPSQHGYLFFRTPGSFRNHEAYTGHTQFYLMFMNALDKSKTKFGFTSLRDFSFLGMAMLAAAAIAIIARFSTMANLNNQKWLLILSALALLLTSPLYWISVSAYNVDNMNLLLGFTLLSCLFASRKNPDVVKYLLASAPSVFFYPMLAVILSSFFIFVLLFTKPKPQLMKGAITILLLGACSFMVPRITANALGLASTSSSWLYRSGLDGSTLGYQNFIQAILHPANARLAQQSTLMILLVLVCIVQMLDMKWGNRRGSDILSVKNDKLLFYGGLSSYYAITAILWPQSVSVHPYLLDMTLFLPIYICIIINFMDYKLDAKRFVIWSAVMAALIMTSLTSIMQTATTIWSNS
ncbi:MAG: hypothetical protein WC637_13360 [Victivallales bacterium]